MRVWKYGLWTASVVVLAWAIALVSALVAGKGIDQMTVTADGTVRGDS